MNPLLAFFLSQIMGQGGMPQGQDLQETYGQSLDPAQNLRNPMSFDEMPPGTPGMPPGMPPTGGMPDMMGGMPGGMPDPGMGDLALRQGPPQGDPQNEIQRMLQQRAGRGVPIQNSLEQQDPRVSAIQRLLANQM